MYLTIHDRGYSGWEDRNRYSKKMSQEASRYHLHATYDLLEEIKVMSY